MLQLVRGGTEQKTIATLCHLLSLKYPGDRVDTVEIFVEDFKEIDEVFDLVNLSLPDYFNLIDWRNLNPSLINLFLHETSKRRVLVK